MTPPTVAAGQKLTTRPTDNGKIPTPDSTPKIERKEKKKSLTRRVS